MDKAVVVHIYNGILLNHKRNEIMPFAETWIELPPDPAIPLLGIYLEKNKETHIKNIHTP